MNIIERFRSRKYSKNNDELNQKILGGVAQMILILRRGPDGDIRFKTTIKGEFKLDEENSTIDAIQKLITKLEEENKTNNWSAIFKHPERTP